MIDIVPLRGSLVDHAYCDLMEDARAADRREWEAASGQEFSTALITALKSYANSGHAWVATYGPHVLLAFGVVEQPLAGVGNAWMVVTNRAVPKYRAIHQHYGRYLELMLGIRPVLHAWADQRNDLHHAWMWRMGFVDADVTHHFQGRYPFRLFVYSSTRQRVDDSRPSYPR